MEHIVEILHQLISHAHGQGMPAARVAELHDLADKADAAAKEAAGVIQDVETVAGDVAEVTGGTPPAV